MGNTFRDYFYGPAADWGPEFLSLRDATVAREVVRLPSLGPNDLVCVCTGRTRSEVERAIEFSRQDPASFHRHSDAGTGCGTCRSTICALAESDASSNFFDRVAKEIGVPKEIQGNVTTRFDLFFSRMQWMKKNPDGLVPDLDRIRSTRFLDLACGSIANESGNSHRISPNRQYEPWLCRLLHHLGATVVGVDLFRAFPKDSPEGWDFHQMDLAQSGVLNVFPPDQFDVVHSDNFLRQTGLKGRRPAPSLERHLGESGRSLDDVETEVWTQALRVLKPEGVFDFSGRTYRKIPRDEGGYGWEEQR